MIKNLVDLLREVFWLKKRPVSRQRRISKSSKTRTVKTPRRAEAKARSTAKPAKVPKPPKSSKPPPKPPKPLKPLRPRKQAKPLVDPSLTRIGEITHYFDRIKVGVVQITDGSILVGDRLTIAGKNGVFVQKVWSMQIESQDVKVAKKGQIIGLKIDKPVMVGNIVYK